MPENCQSKTFKTSIGGQALIEGLLMVGPEKRAMAVRLPDSQIHLEYLPQSSALPIEKIPFLRGSVKLFRQMKVGIGALYRSADLAEEAELRKTEEAAGGQKEKKSFSERNPQLFYTLTTVLALVISVLVFVLLPNAAADLIRRTAKLPPRPSFGWQFLLNLIEGILRIFLFIGYMALTRRSRDLKRVWQYHGAEHKTISCYEARQELSVENVRRFSRFHPRCGTSFLFQVMIVSIILFSLTGWHETWINVLIRLLLIPLVAGISYEIIHWSGQSDHPLAHWLSKPGLSLQRLTTAEPDDGMLEVAITALEAVLPEDQGVSDRW